MALVVLPAPRDVDLEERVDIALPAKHLEEAQLRVDKPVLHLERIPIDRPKRGLSSAAGLRLFEELPDG